MWETIKQYQTVIIVAGIAFIVGFAASTLWNSQSIGIGQGNDVARRGDSTLSNGEGEEEELDNLPPLPIKQETASTPMRSTISAAGNSIAIGDQSPGLSAVASSVEFKEAGWVVVHEDRNGAPGNILGALWLPTGKHDNATVELLRATQAGKMYYAMLHADAGADKTFDHMKDTPLKDASGSVIMMKFTAK